MDTNKRYENQQDEASLSDDMKKLGSDFARVGGKAIKNGINFGFKNGKATRMNRNSQKGVIFSLICKVVGYVMFILAIISFFKIIFSTPSFGNYTSEFASEINVAMSGLSFGIAAMTSLGMALLGCIFIAISHIITLLNISNVRKDKIIELLIDSNEIQFIQNDLLESKK